MSLYGAMYSGITGLSAQSRSLGVISENIANVNTIGYKSSRTQFSTLVTGGAGTSNLGSSGVRAMPSSLVRQQGLLQPTASGTDIGIYGDGFFTVNSQIANGEAVGENLFTRAGAFSVDANRNLVNTSGYYLMGWRLGADGTPVDGNGNPINPDRTSAANLEAVSVGGIDYSAEATRNISVNANLPAAARAGESFQSSLQIYDVAGGTHQTRLDWQKADALDLAGQLDGANAPFTVNQTLTDSLGASHDLALTWTRNAAQDWTLTASTADGMVTNGALNLIFDADGNLFSDAQQELVIDWTGEAADSPVRLDLSGLTEVAAGGSAVTSELNANGATWKLSVSTADTGDAVTGGTTYVDFDQNGSLRAPASYDVAIDWNNAATSAADSAITLSFGTPGQAGGLTALGSEYSAGSLDQDGIALGVFSGVAIDDNGIVNALFDNGQIRAMYRLPVAQFNNPDGLIARTGNAWQQSPESGRFFLNESGIGGAGKVAANALEASTVDLATEFTNMITTQRAYSANATIITTADEMLEELSRIKR